MTEKLIARDLKTNQIVNIGDEVISFRGEKATLNALTRVNEMYYGGRRSGKVEVIWKDGFKSEYYDGVFNLRVERVE